MTAMTSIYFQYSAQLQSLHPHQFYSLLNITYGQIILQLVGRKNSHTRRIGEIISDGCFKLSSKMTN